MKKFIVLLGIVLILALIGYFVMAPDDGGDFSFPPSATQANVLVARENGAVKVRLLI